MSESNRLQFDANHANDIVAEVEGLESTIASSMSESSHLQFDANHTNDIVAEVESL